MMDSDKQFSFCFEQGRRAARIGLSATSNPYLDDEPSNLSAWVEGYRTVDLKTLSCKHRFRIYEEGVKAADRGESASTCPYLDDDPEMMNIWLLGHAPCAEELDVVPSVKPE